jgi:hypothetical protein
MDTKNSLIADEYKCKWEHLRFTEDLDHKSIQLYMILVGGILTFLIKDVKTLDEAINRDLSIPLLIFLWVYSSFLCLLLVSRYKNYNNYLNRLRDIEVEYCNYIPPKPEKRLLSAFTLKYLLVVLIESSCFGLLCYAIFKSFLFYTIFKSSLWSIVVSIAYLLAGLTYLHTSKSRPRRLFQKRQSLT